MQVKRKWLPLIKLQTIRKIIFQIPYKEDWEAEKQLIYYPVHITPGYEASSDVKKVQSDVSVKF